MKGMEALEMEEAESFIGSSRNGRPPTVVKKTEGGGICSKNIFYFLGVVAIVVGMHYVTNGMKEDGPAPAPGGGGTTTGATTPTTPDSPFQSSGSDHGEEKNIKYSEISKIVPDPEQLPIDEATKAELAERWGKWHFWDGEEEERPTKDYCAAYPNRDVPGEDFPDEAWQVDAVFVNHLINDAEKLVTRAMEAIFEEYGHGKPLPPEALAERMKMFRWDKIDLETATEPPVKYQKRGNKGGGGWTTERSFKGLVRRLLHAMNTNDDFVVVMGGHSTAAGHGNHFRQSYMMQFHKIMAPIFARLGVKLITKNLAQGGLGTLHNALGAGSIYGDNIDILLWDSGMTEREAEHQDLFIRQGLLGGKKVPLIWMEAGANFAVGRDLHNNADVDIGYFGTGLDGIPETRNAQQAESLPWAARYVQCFPEAAELCSDNHNKYCAKCWIPRNDIDPEALGITVDHDFPSQVKWHTGFRRHQLTGRVLAFSVLEALQEAIQIWSDGTMGGPPLDDSYWHMTDYNENIRTKLKNLDPSVGACNNVAGLPARVCKTPLKARTLHTPRAKPAETSLTNLLKPAPNGYIPKNEAKPLYDGPDVHNPCFDVPKGDVDVLAIVSGRRRLAEASNSSEFLLPRRSVTTILPKAPSSVNATAAVVSSSRRLGKIVPGTGWQVVDERPGNCDGEYDSICDRSAGDTCPLSGHHDHRGLLVGNEYAGWVVMELPDVVNGIIIVKLFTWLPEETNTRTQGWTSVDNKRRRLGEDSSQQGPLTGDDSQLQRRLKGREKTTLPETFEFDYAINGKVTTLNKAQFLEACADVQRVFEAVTLLDDPGFSGGPTVEVAFRMRGCGRDCTFGLSHVYWA